MESPLYLLALVLVLWYAWPALEVRGLRLGGTALAVFVPLLSWVWLLVIGHQRRRQLARLHRVRGDAARLVAERDQRERDVAFWRNRATHGTPAEREAARLYLESIGVAVEPAEAEDWTRTLTGRSVQELADLRRYYLTVSRSSAASAELAETARAKAATIHALLARRDPRADLAEQFADRLGWWSAGPRR